MADAGRLENIADLNRRMRESGTCDDTWSLVQLNRQFHFEMYSLSPQRLILHEAERLWTLVEPLPWIKFGPPATKRCRSTTLPVDALSRKDLEGYAAQLLRHREPMFCSRMNCALCPARQREVVRLVVERVRCGRASRVCKTNPNQCCQVIAAFVH